MKIGLVDLDTSHPAKWIPIERELGHEVVCVYDGGTVHPAEYVKKFAMEHDIPRVCSSLQEVVELSDCAIIHGCDWDTHVEKAKPFVDAGKAVFLDKPLAGNMRDLLQIRRWAESGARITGGSSLRFCYELRQWLSKPPEERGTPHTAMCGCGVDEFNYAIHAYAMLIGIMGGGVRSVRHLGEGVQRRIRINLSDGRMGFLSIGAVKKRLPFYGTIVTEKTVHQIFNPADIYKALLEATLPYLAGLTNTPPMTPDELIAPELCALAARQSWLNGDCEVLLSQVDLSKEGYDGAAFAKGYCRNKYPSPAVNT